MFTYYYRIWHRDEAGGYDTLIRQGQFRASSWEAAQSRARKLVFDVGKDWGDCCIVFATAPYAQSPSVVYFPPF